MPFELEGIPQPKVIGIVGSRRRNSVEDLGLTCLAFEKIFNKGDSIVSGGCPFGGDRFAEIIARQRGLKITIFHPDWEGKGKAAGILRNSDIATFCDILIAVVAKDRTGGTEDTIEKAKKLGKVVILVEGN